MIAERGMRRDHDVTDGEHTRQSEAGVAGAEFLVGFVFLILVGALIVSAWQVVSAKFELSLAAERAGEAIAMATPSEVQTAGGVQALAVSRALVDPSELTVTVGAGGFNRCTPVQVRMQRQVKPWLALFGTLDVSADYAVIVTPYAADSGSEASCV